MTRRRSIRKNDVVVTSAGRWGVVHLTDKKRKKATVWVYTGGIEVFDWSDLTIADPGTGVEFIRKVYGLDDPEHFERCLSLYRTCEDARNGPPGRACIAFLLTEIARLTSTTKPA